MTFPHSLDIAMTIAFTADRTPFRNKVVIVTGASAGVGRATAKAFARRGAFLGLIARDAEALETTKAELMQLGAPVAIQSCDVADADAVFAAAAAFERELGPIDVWVNAAMVTVFSPISEMTPDEFRRVTEVTYLGFVHGTLAALKYMRARNDGTIVQVGSALAYRGIPLQSAYCAAKFAIRGFTQSLRTELEHDGSRVRVSMVQLPGVNTPQFDWARAHVGRHPRPVPPVFEPEVPARAILRAAREGKAEYWVSRTVAELVLGTMIAPRWIANYLARTTVEGQMTSELISPRRPDNLYAPVGRYHRTHGSFGKQAKRHAVTLNADRARFGIVAAGTAATLGLGFLLGRAAQRFVTERTQRRVR
jgi:NAD(P)-dependent dehydrogenase (short-subunit alcohol dehydrogenase family)